MKVAFLVERSKLPDPGFLSAIRSLPDREVSSEIVFLDSPKGLESELDRLEDQGFERALICGGDGTLGRVVQSLHQTHAPERLGLGVVALGTANDFASAAGLDADSVTEKVISALEAPLEWVDLPLMNGIPFMNAVSGGCVTLSTTDLPSGMKDYLGSFAYHLNAVLKLPQLRSHDLIFSGPDWKIERRSAAFTVANGSRIGGGLHVAPGAKLDDGKLNLLIVPEQPILSLAGLATELLKESPDLSTFDVTTRCDREIQVESPEEIQVNLDGEPRFGRSFHFRVVPQALRMAVARPEALHRQV